MMGFSFFFHDGLCTITTPGLPPEFIHHCLSGSHLSAPLNLLLFIYLFLVIFIYVFGHTGSQLQQPESSVSA